MPLQISLSLISLQKTQFRLKNTFAKFQVYSGVLCMQAKIINLPPRQSGKPNEWNGGNKEQSVTNRQRREKPRKEVSNTGLQ